MHSSYLISAKKQFLYYKSLAEKSFDQLSEIDFFYQPNAASNSIAIIVNHMAGNMLSRWTDIFNTDGEKTWRNRDSEFENILTTKAEVLERWQTGWHCFFVTLDSLKPADLDRIIYIRNEGQTVMEAILRQMAHYPHHVGQIIFLAKQIKGDDFVSLSIPKNQSNNYNQNKFEQEKSIKHFTDSEMKEK
jgi:uncharacterized damage-inducible protein DinB